MGRIKLTTKSDIDFKPSLFCDKRFPKHRRQEICTELQGDKKYHAIGICVVCKGEHKYEHVDLSQYGSIVQPSKQRDFILFHDKPERGIHMSRKLAGGL